MAAVDFVTGEFEGSHDDRADDKAEEKAGQKEEKGGQGRP